MIMFSHLMFSEADNHDDDKDHRHDGIVHLFPGEGHSALWCAVREQREDMVGGILSSLSSYGHHSYIGFILIQGYF